VKDAEVKGKKSDARSKKGGGSNKKRACVSKGYAKNQARGINLGPKTQDLGKKETSSVEYRKRKQTIKKEIHSIGKGLGTSKGEPQR